MLQFIVGALFGGAVGAGAMCLCICAGEADRINSTNCNTEKKFEEM
ncbi:MAG: DUF3789 domain-containing protein [Ruminococcus sp.]|nr:DUF3789 domain-containing protein [Ruminococcus sp.]